jgi:hypothetical protein
MNPGMNQYMDDADWSLPWVWDNDAWQPAARRQWGGQKSLELGLILIAWRRAMVPGSLLRQTVGDQMGSVKEQPMEGADTQWEPSEGNHLMISKYCNRLQGFVGRCNLLVSVFCVHSGSIMAPWDGSQSSLGRAA